MYYYFALWRKDGTDKQIHDLLRMQMREQVGRGEDPSAVVLDSQSVRAAAGVPKTTTGLDAAKKTPGRKRGLVIILSLSIIWFAGLVVRAEDSVLDEFCAVARGSGVGGAAVTGLVEFRVVDRPGGGLRR